MSKGRIITKFEPPPIPWRGADWRAQREEYDFGDCIGLGRTEKEAIADLEQEEAYHG